MSAAERASEASSAEQANESVVQVNGGANVPIAKGFASLCDEAFFSHIPCSTPLVGALILYDGFSFSFVQR